MILTVIFLAIAVGLAIVIWRMRQQEHQRSAARVAALAAVIDADPAAGRSDAVAVSSMFETTPGAAVQGRPVIKVGVGLVMAVILIVAAAMGGDTRTEPPPARASTAIAPLELVSMRHTHEGNVLTVQGLVRNPRAGTALTRVTAVVFAFDGSGGFLASGHAPLDFTTLDAGDESPFVVTIPSAAHVARYRVTFRTEAGVIRHVDRRRDPLRLATR